MVRTKKTTTHRQNERPLTQYLRYQDDRSGHQDTMRKLPGAQPSPRCMFERVQGQLPQANEGRNRRGNLRAVEQTWTTARSGRLHCTQSRHTVQ